MKPDLFFQSGLSLTALVALLAAPATGCGPQASDQAATAAAQQEVARLRAENQELVQARADNDEVQRLKQENQDLPKIRSQYQEATRLKKENEQLRQQVTRISPAAAAAATEAAAAMSAAGGAASLGQAPGAAGEHSDTNAVALAEGHINEADDIMVEPKHLQQLLPEFDWEKLGRTEPLGIKALLERDGVQITNVAQLKEYGITNFVIQRAPTTNAPAPAR